jgi:predicted XRE-type DNA-binding protein
MSGGKVVREKMVLSRDNVFADLGLKDHEEMRIRSDLMSEVVNVIRGKDLSQKEIAAILRISEPKVSALMSGKINDFSNDTLMKYLALLGCKVEIRVTPQHHGSKIKRGAMKVRRFTGRKGSIKSKV